MCCKASSAWTTIHYCFLSITRRWDSSAWPPLMCYIFQSTTRRLKMQLVYWTINNMLLFLQYLKNKPQKLHSDLQYWPTQSLSLQNLLTMIVLIKWWWFWESIYFELSKKAKISGEGCSVTESDHCPKKLLDDQTSEWCWWADLFWGLLIHNDGYVRRWEKNLEGNA